MNLASDDMCEISFLDRSASTSEIKDINNKIIPVVCTDNLTGEYQK